MGQDQRQIKDRSKTDQRQKQRHPSQQRGREAIERGWKGGQRHWPAPPFHPVSPSQIAEDRLPRRRECVSFRQVPSAGRPRIRALPKLPPSQRPQIQSDLWPGRAKPLVLRLPASHKATARVSPRRQKSARAAPRPDQRQQHCAAPKNPRTTADMPAIARPVESFRN
jgi:hypothetical protein